MRMYSKDRQNETNRGPVGKGMLEHCQWRLIGEAKVGGCDSRQELE